MTRETSGNRQDLDATKLFEQLRDAVQAEIKRTGGSIKSLSLLTKVAESSIQNLLNGRGVTLDSFATLARWAGLELVLREKITGVPDAAISAIMNGLADADEHEANGAECVFYVLDALKAVGYSVSRSPTERKP